LPPWRPWPPEIVLALHHPSRPGVGNSLRSRSGALRDAMAALVAVRPAAVLPAANFAPWTGWIVFDEFDLVFMGAAAAGFASLARSARDLGPPGAAHDRGGLSRRQLVLLLLCAPAGTFAALHGLTAVRGRSKGWYDEYSDPLNALRVGKGPLYALLLLPLMQHELRRSGDDAFRRVAAGMLAGTAIVVVAVLMERTAYPGLFDFSQPYRTTALFWEMHVGGAAIDGYLALAWPFVAWAVLRSRTAVALGALGRAGLLVGYACLTTFSRGLYLAFSAESACSTSGWPAKPLGRHCPPGGAAPT
jgi:hypothetical protein